MQPQMSPEIMEALMRRRAGGVGGGNTAPAAMQTMQPNPMGGPIGPSTTPLNAAPQAMPTGGIPQTPPQSQGAPSGSQNAQSANQGANVDDQTKLMTKALMQRLLKFL